MSKNKNQIADGSRKQAKKTSAAAPRSSNNACPSCGKASPPDALFCPHCGKPLNGQTKGAERDPVAMTLYAIIGIAIVGTVAGLIYVASVNDVSTPAPISMPSSAPPRSAPPVDLASMSPREAADRLFNRIMMADEQGNMAEVTQFAPMAIEAYALVENLDADAHYHLGLIHAATGDLDNVRKEIGILKQFSPNHLLGLLLEYDVAKQLGDQGAAEKAVSAFKTAYPSEFMAGRPEYQAHAKTIERFLAAKAGG